MTERRETSVDSRKTSVQRLPFQHLILGASFLYICAAQTEHMARITPPLIPMYSAFICDDKARQSRAEFIEYVLPAAGHLQFPLHHWTLFLTTPQNGAIAAAQLAYLLSMGGPSPPLSRLPHLQLPSLIQATAKDIRCGDWPQSRYCTKIAKTAYLMIS